MITIFTIPKPFTGTSDILQRNAIKSWTELEPKCEVILFGDDEGVDKTAKEYGVLHIPEVEKNEFGTPLLRSAFSKADEIASNDILCYVNADIIFLSDIIKAIKKIQLKKFMMVGQRWDLDIPRLLDFNDKGWENNLKERVKGEGKLHDPNGIDYFIFPIGQVKNFPKFAVGRPGWDNWFIYSTNKRKIPVIDATIETTVIHQNHDYSFYPDGEKGIRGGVEAKMNLEVAGGYWQLMNIKDSTHFLEGDSIRKKPVIDLFRSKAMLVFNFIYHPALRKIYKNFKRF